RLQRGRLLFVANRQALGPHELDVTDADERKRRPQVGLLEIHGGAGRLLAVEAAAAGSHDHALSAGQTLRPVGRVVKRLDGHQYTVEPGLELAGNGEVV